MRSWLEATQKLGGALMLPIAVLPVAGLLLRLGQPDLLDIPMLAAAGDAIFANLGLLFAVGVAIGLARENHGAAALAGVVGFFVATRGAEVLVGLPPADAAKAMAKLSVPIGILSGLIAGWLYNRYADIKLPPYLAFFGGRRFVPIAAGGAGLVLAIVFGQGWPVLSAGMDALSRAVVASGELGLFIYGVLNRALIVTGLHHILNNVAWFIVGDFGGATGDLKRFFAGDPTAGAFMAGFFPVMMFGLPAACLAMYHTALPEKRRAAGGLLLSMALTSFLTGVTEPIEFTFMFLAPGLYALHAVLTGLAMVTMDLLGVKLGFGFSAGFFDYALNYGKSTHPLYLLPVGAAYALLYYGLFRWCIVRFGLKTPGRDRDEGPAVATSSLGEAGLADAYIAALGGRANLADVTACTTRLRLELADRSRVDPQALRALGARGTVQVGERGLQVVSGPAADQVAGSMRARLAAAPASTGVEDAIVAALGGAGNLARVGAGAGRVLVELRDAGRIDEPALERHAPRGFVRVGGDALQIPAPDAQALAARLSRAGA